MSDAWYVGRGGQRRGPVSWADLQGLAAGGKILPTDLVWREGMADWVAASTIAGLFAPAPSVPPVNPYAAPVSSDFIVPGRQIGQSMEYADYMARVGAAILDGIFVGLMGCIPGFFIGFVFVTLAGGDRDAQAGAAVLAQICSQIVGLAIGVTYSVVLETSTRQGTWGKQIVGIKVTDLEGRRITVGRALGRYFAHWITGLTCGIGMLMPLWTEKKQTLHDMIAGCLALKK